VVGRETMHEDRLDYRGATGRVLSNKVVDERSNASDVVATITSR
jgi:hypothetical protein